MTYEIPRLMIAAASSGSGKTTVTCALLRALIRRGLRPASFKCGPDYIDPMFHHKSIGTAFSSNLDLFLGDADTARYWLCRGARNADLAVIEGVMGFYDGLAAKTFDASSYDLARQTKTPVVLVVGCKGMSVSIAAQVKGFTALRPDANIQAVLLNQISPALYPDIKRIVEESCGVPVMGYLPQMPDCALESRHLGLVTAAEVSRLSEKLDHLAGRFCETVEIERLLAVARAAPPLAANGPAGLARPRETRVAVARDRAFCFYYADTLALLRDLGAELLEFSPLRDKTLPDGAQALLIGGGYPELYARELSDNIRMRASVGEAVKSGMPAIAECGGFLYLGKTLEDMDGAALPMAGAIPAGGYKTDRLRRFGYVELHARVENLLCAAGETLRAHEFHYWDSTDPGSGFWAQKPLRETGWDCVHAGETLYAGFPHLYLAGNPKAAVRFLQAAAAYRKD